jgi:hypothetical protein
MTLQMKEQNQNDERVRGKSRATADALRCLAQLAFLNHATQLGAHSTKMLSLQPRGLQCMLT